VTRSSRKPGLQQEWEQRLFPDQAPDILWRNITNPNSMRLATPGFKCLVERLHLPYYHFKTTKGITNLHLLQLDHLLRSPYYIKTRTMIELFGEEDSIMLSLHCNDLEQYLDNLQKG
jgi:hypothetical protein